MVRFGARYEGDDEFSPLAFEIFKRLEINHLSEKKTLDNYPEAKSTGLYISPNCKDFLKKQSEDVFGTIYFGCTN